MQNTYCSWHWGWCAHANRRPAWREGALYEPSMFSPLIFILLVFMSQPSLLSQSLIPSWQWQTCIHIHKHTHILIHFTYTLNRPPSLTSFYPWNTHAHSFLRLRHILFASLWVSHHYLERVPVFGHSMPPSQRWTEQPRHRLLVVTQLSQTCLITAVANVRALK